MISKRFSVAVGLLLGSAGFCLSPSVQAVALAESRIGFSNLQIRPAQGTLPPPATWSLEAFAQAQNSLGELKQEFDSDTSPGTVSADAAVTWAMAHGDASALGSSANSTVNIPPHVKDQFATSSGRGTLFNTFMISGGTGSVSVDFSADVTRFLHVLTQDNGVLADTDTTFALTVFGGDLLNPLTPLFFHDRLLIGPDAEESRTGSLPPLFGTALLTFGVTYSMVLESDSESFGVVPEPPTIALLLLSLGILAGFVRKPA